MWISIIAAIVIAALAGAIVWRRRRSSKSKETYPFF